MRSALRLWNTYGSAWCDYNNDGWIDLVTGGGIWDEGTESTDGYSVHLFKNLGAEADTGREWLEVELHGRESNSAAIGARVSVEVDTDDDGIMDLNMLRDVNGGTSVQGQQDSMVLHFGLGGVKGDVSLTVDWPRGRTVRIESVEPSSRLKLFEPTDPIGLDLEIQDVREAEGGTVIELRYYNPSGYVVDFHELVLNYRYPDQEVKRSINREDVPAGEESYFEIIDQDILFKDLLEVEVSISRSYPPLSYPSETSFLVNTSWNEPPVPVLSAPLEVGAGEEISIDGSSSFDPDGDIKSYMFDFGDGTRTGWANEPLTTHTYDDPDEYFISLMVTDDSGQISEEPATRSITVLEGESSLPSAVILEISPLESIRGETVAFQGEGSPSPDERISEYRWTSSIDGFLSRRSSFEEDDLSEGEHEISFLVRDSSGTWSSPDTRSLKVLPIVIEPPWVTIDPFRDDGPLRGTVMITGSSGPEGEIELVEVRVDSGSWEDVRGTLEWEYVLDTRELDPGMDHLIQARSYADRYYSKIVSMTFMVEEQEMTGAGITLTDRGSEEIPLSFLFLSILSLLLLLTVLVVFLVKNSKRNKPRMGNVRGPGEGFND